MDDCSFDSFDGEADGGAAGDMVFAAEEEEKDREEIRRVDDEIESKVREERAGRHDSQGCLADVGTKTGSHGGCGVETTAREDCRSWIWAATAQ